MVDEEILEPRGASVKFDAAGDERVERRSIGFASGIVSSRSFAALSSSSVSVVLIRLTLRRLIKFGNSTWLHMQFAVPVAVELASMQRPPLLGNSMFVTVPSTTSNGTVS